MALKIPTYLDHHATTPVDPQVLEAMLPYFAERYGNPASRGHALGLEAERAVEAARRQVARALGAGPEEIFFTSGATESNNIALRGAAQAGRARRDHLVTAATEHKSVVESMDRLGREGFRVTVLPVGRDGLLSPDRVAEAVDERTLLVSLMAANNEIGVLHPLAEIGSRCRERGVLFHVDAAQAVGKIPLDVEGMKIDLLSLTAHKVYGPKGVGALYVRARRPRVELSPLLEGGGQERGLRPGTLNVPGIVGLGSAVALGVSGLEAESLRLARLKERLWSGLQREVDGIVLNGDPLRRLPGNLNVSIPGVDGEALRSSLTEVCVSAGSACASGSLEPSHVLKAIGLKGELARSTIRFGLGRWTTEEEIDHAVHHVASVVRGLRSGMPRSLRTIARTEART